MLYIYNKNLSKYIIVMSWSRDLQVTDARDPVTPQPCLLCHRYEPIFVPPHCRYNLSIIPTDLASRSLETWVAMLPVDQIDAACRSNVGQNLGRVQSISMITTQPFANCERAVECHLTYSVFYIAKEPSSVI